MDSNTIDGINILGIDGPWYVQLGVVMTLLISIATVLRLVVWPFVRNVWRAIIAAPRLAEGVGRLVELMETDILGRVERLEIRIETDEQKISNLESEYSSTKVRLEAHDKRADATETRLAIIEYRETGERKSDELPPNLR